MTTTRLEKKSDNQLWLAAIKPPMYSVAVVPITVGTAVAFAENKIIHGEIFITFLLSAILIIAWLNISNDVFDAETGIDANKAESLVNLTGNKTLLFWLSNLFLGCGILGILTIAYLQQDWTVLKLILLCCILGYSYQGPPFRLGYQGLGELICFVTFGPLAISAAYYSQTQNFSLASIFTSVIIGVTTSIILFCSHFHQVEDDLAAGKLSPIVRLGTKNSSYLLIGAVVSIYVLTFLFVATGYLSWWTLIVSLSLPLAYELIDYVCKYHNQPKKVKSCKYIAVKLHFFSGVLLTLGLLLSTVNL
ncbi:MAG: 2-carboxy-1,4-naphthoquinone phytyltransferase [Spirulinaceae cyanobacterium]